MGWIWLKGRVSFRCWDVLFGHCTECYTIAGRLSENEKIFLAFWVFLRHWLKIVSFVFRCQRMWHGPMSKWRNMYQLERQLWMSLCIPLHWSTLQPTWVMFLCRYCYHITIRLRMQVYIVLRCKDCLFDRYGKLAIGVELRISVVCHDGPRSVFSSSLFSICQILNHKAWYHVHTQTTALRKRKTSLS